ncbi:hypothetical protein AVEN_78722-1 [Araneus ventricosus]|uniref:Uncharacterized protein n=1 Tax=Araneus ventricosus TaxID=182803 RepID=A0A4Y2VKR0_ARAVE|nr:hypothetical protein AVEN_78722-1 [Araneus ventricosus]
MNPDFHSSRRWSCQGTPSARRTVAPLLYTRSYIGWWWRYYALGTFSWAALGPVVAVEQTMKAANYPKIIADQLQPCMAFVFTNWKWNLPAGQRPVSQGSNCVGVVRGAY